MFSQNNEEKKLDWMYKGPTSTVDREDYLLGRPVDKTLDQLNDEEKQKQQNLIQPPKNRVEHECIPPSIRDFNKVVQSEQVDLSAKLQEDPLVTIKKREEESRRQFLQNPVQLKKLQKALKAQQAKKNKKKKKSRHGSDSDLDAKLAEKLLGKKKKKASKEERDLDTILMHKYEQFKHKLTDDDLREILNGKDSDSECSEGESSTSRKKSKKKKNSSSDDSEDEKNSKRRQNSRQKFHGRRYKRSSDSSAEDERTARSRQTRYDSDDSDSSKNKKVNYGLVTSDGTKIAMLRTHNRDRREDKPKSAKAPEPPPKVHKAKKLSEEEKEKRRREMMEDAAARDRERARNVRRYRDEEDKEKTKQDYDPEFAHKQFIKSTQDSSVESRIKSKLNNIQRSSRDMDRHFSRRH